MPDPIPHYRYDNANRLTAIVDSKSDGTINAIYKYTLDKLGNRTAMSFRQPLTVTHSPQPSLSYTPDADNRLITAGNAELEYDPNGNLDTVTLGSEVRDFTWDYENRLTGLTVGANVYEYKYDGLGNRVSRKVNGLETRYLPGALGETDSNGNITAYYVYGLGLISKITPSDQVYYYHFDGIGSIIAISDSSGDIVNKYAYDEFGKVLDQVEATPNPFKYVGRYGVMDEGNGLLYMRARYYDPEVGRFISKDPIGFEGGINLYAYVYNNPVDRIDPSGLKDDTCNKECSLRNCYSKCLDTLLGTPLEYLSLTLGFAGAFGAGSIPIMGVPALPLGGAWAGGYIGAYLGTEAATGAAAGVAIGFSMGEGALLGLGYSGAALGGWGVGVLIGCGISCELNPCNY